MNWKGEFPTALKRLRSRAVLGGEGREAALADGLPAAERTPWGVVLSIPSGQDPARWEKLTSHLPRSPHPTPHLSGTRAALLKP